MTDKPLRILVIVNLPWDPRLGAIRVWVELAEQWRAAGHTVEKFSLSDAFADAPTAPRKFALRQALFPRRAAAFVRQNTDRFDVIDALIGTLPYSKQELDFRGLLVARSVGLYLLYDEFERDLRTRWPQTPKGTLLGRLLYRTTSRRLTKAADQAVREADLVNVPNEEEAGCLREAGFAHTPILVQPYGLTEARKRAFAEAAAAPEQRLGEQRVCFIGMWGARKGAYDWPRIIQRVRAEVPGAKFRFLGTMIDDAVVRRELGTSAEGIELTPAYEPDELPALLGDCTVGAFPSYVEGFGLAVIEQLAAGIPTVAYDTAGPRDILGGSLRELLVPKGDVDAFAATICRLLQSQPAAYRELSERCAAREFSWPKVAEDTLEAYTTNLQQLARPVVFVQPFGIGSAGGGARILRALLECSPLPWRSICSSPQKPQLWRNEVHLPMRPSWGRMEHGRLSGLPKLSTPLFVRSFQRRLRERCRKVGASGIHAIPHHGLDFSYAQSVAKELGIPFFLSLHDDLAYTAAGVVPHEQRERAMRSAWRDAAARFVISQALGAEYCRRYGDSDYEVVTDGLRQLHALRGSNEYRIYFMGLFHMNYERNLRALLDALLVIRQEHPSAEINVTLRCEYVRPHVLSGDIPVRVLPFADEAQVERDLESADLLYMPLHFGEEHANFARYSLSTKMVTYIGSGLPILYHGPKSSAAYELLQQHQAALLLPTLAAAEIADSLNKFTADARRHVAANALELARRNFMLDEQAQRFWSTISRQLKPTDNPAALRSIS